MSEFASIRHALEIARQNGYSEVEIEVDGVKFQAALEPQVQDSPAMPVLAVAQTPENGDRFEEISAPCVGYFSPDGTELRAGDRVEKSQVVAVITALGLANEVESKQSGEVVDVLAKKGDAVEYGQTLYRVKVNA